MIIVVSEKTFRLAYESLESPVAVRSEYVWKDSIRHVAITFASEEDAVAFKLKFGI